MASIWLVFNDWTIASSLENCSSPNAWMCGFWPYQLGFAWNSVIWSFTHLVTMNGPPDTSGLPPVGVLG